MRFRRLREAIEIMGRNAALNDREMISALNSAGFSARDSRVLVAFIPSAFARPVLEKLGVGHIVDSVSAPTNSGGWIEVPLNSVPIYNGALAIAHRRPAAGQVDPEYYGTLALRSAELSAASRALDAGANVKGASIASALVDLTAEELGYGSWLARIRRWFVV